MPRPRFRSVLVTALLALFVLALGAADTSPCDLREAARRARQSVVEVTTRLSVDGLPVNLPDGHSVCRNIGFFVGSDGRVLTSALGIAAGSSITVRTSDGRQAAARMVALDQAAGLALLDSKLQDTVPLRLRAEPTGAGEVLALAGCSGGDGPCAALKPGLVASADAATRLNGIQWDRLLALSAVAPAGSAAAPLLDARGQLAGIVLATGPRDAEPLTLVLPTGQLRRVLARLERGESRRLGWLGVSVVREAGGLEGARVADVLESSPAHRAGILPGDVLLQIGDAPLRGPEGLTRVVAARGPRQNVTFHVLRGETLEKGTVNIEARPLLICKGARRPGEDSVRLRWRRSAGGPDERTDWRLRRLMEENRRLRTRVRGLEKQLESAERPAE